MKKLFLVIAALGIFILIIALSGEESSPSEIQNNFSDEGVVLVPATIHEEGWKTPVKLGFNDEGWEDSPYLTRDGKQLLFFYHPWGNLAVPEVAEKLTEIVVSDPERAVREGLDGKIYVSDYPFNTKRVHPISADDSPANECCPYISESGDFYYTSNRRSFELGRGVPEKIYVNGRMLDLGTGGAEGNPHYCDAKDELWFDCPGDTRICVMRDAKKSNFSGKVELAPYPINYGNEPVNDFQPFLTDDCNTLYFTSTRPDGQVSKIFKTTRQGEGWSEPELFVSHPSGVAEISMTSDGRAMAFAQLFWREDGTPGIDIWYSEKS